MPTDRLQYQINVGDSVMIPGVVTSIGGTDARPTVVVTTKFAGYDLATDVMAELDCIQVIYDQSTPKS